MVSSSVSLLVIGLLFVMLVAGMRLYRHGSSRSELQVAATLGLGRLAADLDRTTPAGLSVRSDGVGLVPLRGISADGRQLWREELILYWHSPSSQTFLRRASEDPTYDPTNPLTLSKDALQALFLADGPEPTVMARDVVSLEISRPTGRLLHVRLELAREALRFELQRDICLRNP